MNDIDRHDEGDQRLDRNLQVVAPHLELPQEPSLLQQVRWKNPATPDTAGDTKGILGMKRGNFWRVLGAGGALAACVAIAAVVGLGGTKTVEASAIFDSLRDAIRQSLWIEIDDVPAEGLTVNGRVLLVYDTEDHANNDDDGVASTYIELQIRADDDHEDYPGLDIETAMGLSLGNEWVFVQSHELPANLFAENPIMGLFASMLSNGIIVDLAEFGVGGSSGHIAIGMPSAGDGEENVVAESEDSNGRELKFTFGVSGETDAEGKTVDPAVHHVNEHMHSLMFGTDFRTSGDSREGEAAMAHHIQLVENFLTGKFTNEQMGQFIDMIESSADQTSVAKNGDGSFTLMASGFKFNGHDDADEDLVLEVVYRDDAGIERVDLLNLGDGAGRLRFTFSEDDENADVFDRTRYSSQAGVQSLNDILGIFGGDGR